MPQAIHKSENEFWQPPQLSPVPTRVGPLPDEICFKCGSEYISGSHYCYSCGHRRSDAAASHPLSSLQASKPKTWMPAAAVVAAAVGLVCLAGAAIAGFLPSSQAHMDLMAVQVWRIEWLTGATAAFVASILLSRY